MPVKVLEPVQSESQSGVKGINLLNNETIHVFLTTKGKSAENEKRPSIETLFSGIETQGTLRKLKSGGIICMNGAFARNEGGYYAQWPMVVKYSDNEDTVLLCDHGTLIPNENHQGRTSADFYSFHPGQSIKGAKVGTTMKQAQARNAKQTNRPAYLIRIVEGKQVLDYEIHQAVYDKTVKEPMSAEQIADSVAQTAQGLLDRYPGKKLDILPVTRFFVPSRILEKRRDYFNKQQSFFSRTWPTATVNSYVAKP